MLVSNVLDGPKFDYVSMGFPMANTNPRHSYATWFCLATGELYICLDAKTDENVWKGQFGTTIAPIYPDDISNLVCVVNFEQNDTPVFGSYGFDATAGSITYSTNSKFGGYSANFSAGNKYWIVDQAHTTFSLSGWMSFNSPPSNKYLAGAYVSSNTDYLYVYLGASGEILMSGGNTTYSTDTNPVNFDWEIDRWYHIAFVWTNSTQMLDLYIDGALVKSRYHDRGIHYLESQGMTFGGARNASTGGSHYIDVLVDRLRGYSKALTADEVMALYLEPQYGSSIVYT